MPRMNIEAERARLGMDKTQLCAELGITYKTYQTYINGGPFPSTVLEKLHHLTGKSIDYLLNLE